MLKILTVILGCFVLFGGKTFEASNLKRCSDKYYRYEFYVTQKTVNIKKDRLYFWFKGGAVHSANAGANGLLLDKMFTKTFHSNQLAEQGVFKKGLKSGLWKEWHENGELKTEHYYKSGRKQGKFLLYDENGGLIEKGYYKRNLKDGKWVNFVNKDTIFYKRGVPKEKKKKLTKEEIKLEKQTKKDLRKAEKAKKTSKKALKKSKQKIKPENNQSKKEVSELKKSNFFKRMFNSNKNKN